MNFDRIALWGYTADKIASAGLKRELAEDDRKALFKFAELLRVEEEREEFGFSREETVTNMAEACELMAVGMRVSNNYNVFIVVWEIREIAQRLAGRCGEYLEYKTPPNLGPIY